MSRASGLLAGLLALSLPQLAPAQSLVADIRQGTNISIALAPAGDTLFTDLLGGLWRLPASGGGATALIPPGQGIAQPRLAPDGGRLVMQRFSDGQWDLWLVDVDTGERRALTHTPYDERQPEFTADGRSIVFSANGTGRYALWSLDLTSGALAVLNDDPGDSFFPSVSDRGDIAYVHLVDGIWSLRLLGKGPRGTELLHSEAVLTAPSWRPGGGVIVYGERDATPSSRLMMLLLADEPVIKPLTANEDLFPSRPAWVSPNEYFYTADGQIWKRALAGFSRRPVHLFAGVNFDLGPAYSFDAPLDAPGPYPARGIVDLTMTSDGRRAVFSALGDLWVADRRGAQRLTDDAFVEIDPSLSPDSSRVVFASDRSGDLDLWQLPLDGGEASQLSFESGKANHPQFSPNGRLIAYIESVGLGALSSDRLRLLDVAGDGEAATLGDGFFAPSTPRWQVVDGEPRIVLEARFGSPAAPRTSRHLDIAGNRLLPVATDEPPARPEWSLPGLQWSQDVPQQPYVIQVGRLFDGVRNTYQRHMDIHVSGQRIVAIVGRDVRPLPATVIDAREATVVPGLIDVHSHQSSLTGERLGRMWLAHGVTTVRELTSDLPEALQRSEAWASGRRAGPRLVVSPAAGAQMAIAGEPLGPATIVLEAGHRLSSGLAHDLSQQALRLGYPRLPGLELLTMLAPGAPSPPSLSVSPLLRSYQDSLGTVISSHQFMSTGLAAAAGIALPRSRRGGDLAYRLLFRPEEQEAWQTHHGDNDEVLRPLQNTLARLVRTGAPVVTGSDAPAVPYGYGLHLELELLAEAEIAADQVLRLATAQGAMALGLDAQIGTLEAGKLADLVVLDGDPLARISDTLNIVAVVSRGRWYDRAELMQP